MPRVRTRDNDFSSGEWAPRFDGRVDIDKYFRSCFRLENGIVLHSGGMTRRPGTRYAGAAKFGNRKCRVERFEFSTTQAYILEVGHLYIRFWANGGQVVSGGNPVEVTTSYQESELPALKFTQSADVLIIAHPSHPPAKLERLSASLFRLSDITFMPPPSREYGARPVGTLTPSAVSGNGITLTASVDSFLISDVGRNVLVTAGANNGAKVLITAFTDRQNVTGNVVFVFQDVTANAAGNWSIDASPKSTVTPSLEKPEGKTGVTLTADIESWRGLTGLGDSDCGKFVHIDGGEYEITLITSRTVAQATIRGQATAASAAPPGAWTLEEASWSVINGYPACCSFTDLDRLAFGDTTAQPVSFWLSQSGNYFNYGGGVLDDDAIDFALNTDQMNAIAWIKSARDLVIGTLGAEFIIRTPNDAPLTPTNPNSKSNTTWGSSSTVTPVRVGNAILFLTRSGRRLRENAYVLTEDTYAAPDLTLLSDHLTETVRLHGTVTNRAIVDMAYQREPISTVWAVRADGVLLGMTYLRDQNLVGWHRHVTGTPVDDTASVPYLLSDGTKVYPQIPAASDGIVESVAIIPHPDGDREQVWLSVLRTVNGATVRYLEYLDDKGHFYDALTMDATLTYDGTVTGATLTPSATSGSATFTASAPTFAASDVGKVIRVVGQVQRATITVFTNSTTVTASIPPGAEFPNLTPIAAGAWGLAAFIFTGLTHLIGKTVDVLGDGAVLAQQVVTNAGTITNASAAVKVEVGLPFDTDLITQRPEFSVGTGTVQGMPKHPARVIARLVKTLGATLNGVDIPFRTAADPMGAAPTLFSGDVDVTNLGWDTAGRVRIQQKQPLPMTVTLLSSVMVTADP